MTELQQLQQQITKAFGGDYLTTAQFNTLASKLFEMMANHGQENKRVIEHIKATYAALLTSQGQKHDQLMADLKKQVDSLFIGQKFNQMKAEHDAKMQAVDTKLKTIKNGRDGLPGKKGDRGPAGSPDSPEQIRDKLETLKGEDRLDASAIKGLEDRLAKLEKRPVGGMGGGGSAREFFKEYDISSQLDGTTKTFNLPAVWYIFAVEMSSYPYGAMQKTTDYTNDTTSITFGSSIDAPTQLAVGQKVIVKYIVA